MEGGRGGRRRRRWEAMEVDCLVNVFARLGLDDLTLSVPFVCKSWLAAALDPLCWKKLDFRRLELLPWSHFPKSFTLHYSLPFFSFTYLLRFAVCRSCDSATELRFPLKTTSVEDLIFASNKCPNLKSVALPVLSPDEEEQIPNLIRSWKNLERLQMEIKPSNFSELLKSISRHCRRFSELRVSGSIREEDAMAIVGFLPRLKKVDLSRSYLPKAELMIILNGCRKLGEVIVENCVGFHGGDGEILAMASEIKEFRDKGSKLCYVHELHRDDSLGFHGYAL
ncbi:F-box/LRR-repeat protein [Apostasia shenzhenica]|uniref:F-box/LRR-repeat protein n=1 Tax=Apostasia shenzhenica TaxID=1088818 RepID=A0A2I0B2F3_9ASPA|nr:F-box/LRR-repeat protein [Apostasia shenzhenica]